MGKGEETRDAIVDKAMRLASTIGLEGLSIGGLANDMGLSKSGLFAHFRSKEKLQMVVVGATIERFVDKVVRPALKQPRGLPRIRGLFENWMAWASDSGLPGGCLLVTAAVEFDDRPGAIRTLVANAQKDWVATLTKATSLAIAEGHLKPDLDATQFAYEAYSLMLGSHHYFRLLRDPKTIQRARRGFERLVQSAQL